VRAGVYAHDGNTSPTRLRKLAERFETIEHREFGKEGFSAKSGTSYNWCITSIDTVSPR